jgi:hypothetical protein
MCGAKMKITKQEAFERMWKGEVVLYGDTKYRILGGMFEVEMFVERWELCPSSINNFNRDVWSTIEQPEDAFKILKDRLERHFEGAHNGCVDLWMSTFCVLIDTAIKLMEQRYKLERKV